MHPKAKIKKGDETYTLISTKKAGQSSCTLNHNRGECIRNNLLHLRVKPLNRTGHSRKQFAVK
ncbi:MAG TPA: hypothetical protein DD706_03355 [Nitrospiraceae bacterium]|nr:hypothetical protein [Nitrospiraceae bacterium]